MSLLDRYGLDEREQVARQHFLGLGAADLPNLRRLRAAFVARADDFADKFYRHLLADEASAQLLRDPVLLERLKKLQADYFAGLLDGIFDAAYFETRLRVGQVHQRVGLPPVLYLGAYNHTSRSRSRCLLKRWAATRPPHCPRYCHS